MARCCSSTRMLRRLSIVVFLFALLIFVAFLSYGLMPLHKRGDDASWVWRIEPGRTLSGCVQETPWTDHVAFPKLFSWMMQGLGQSYRVKPGEYAITPNTTPFGLLLDLTRGNMVTYRVTLVEGASWHALQQALSTIPRYQDLGAPLDEKSIQKALGIPYKSLEGLFFPTTYQWDWLTHDAKAYQQAYALMQSHLQEVWLTRASDLPYKTPYELLIAASLIEREVRVADERFLVSAVIKNRLKKNMRLQIDATVLYGLGRSSGIVSHRDLRRRTPYNTYLIHGLPPGPIALPSKASLEAAGHPADSEVLYYVLSDSEGHHQFSVSWPEHQKAVRLAKRRVKKHG